MITCKLGEKNYSVDFITGRALREIEPAAKMYAETVKISNAAANGETLPEEAQKLSIATAMDVMVRWFCILFQNQFTPADVYDNYPADRLILCLHAYKRSDGVCFCSGITRRAPQ